MVEVPAAQVRYTETMIRAAVGVFVWRRFVLKEKHLWALAAAMLILCGWSFAQDGWSWLVILTGSAALLPPLFVLAGWRAHLRASLGRLRALPQPEAEFDFDGQGFRVTSGLGEVFLPWSSVTELWARSEAWILIIAPNQFVTMPIENIPTQTLDRLRDWLGAKVIDL